MATIDISRTHTLARDEAKRRAEDLARSMDEKLGLTWRWEGDHIHFEAPSGVAKGTTGTVEVTDSIVRVQINLPFLLRVLKGKVESKVNEKLDEIL